MPLRKDLGFVHQATGLRIELHWRLFLNPHAMAETSIMAASRVVPLAGAAGLRTLGEEDLFAYLCMHGALHWWNRLKWLADVNALLASTPENGVERLVRAAEARGAGRAAAQALLLCRKLLQTPLPASLTATLDKSATVRWLEATALKAMTTGQGEHDPHEVRFRDDPRQPLDLSSQPQLALSVGRAEYPTEKPNRRTDPITAAAAAVSLSGPAATALGVATYRPA